LLHSGTTAVHEENAFQIQTFMSDYIKTKLQKNSIYWHITKL